MRDWDSEKLSHFLKVTQLRTNSTEGRPNIWESSGSVSAVLTTSKTEVVRNRLTLGQS